MRLSAREVVVGAQIKALTLALFIGHGDTLDTARFHHRHLIESLHRVLLHTLIRLLAVRALVDRLTGALLDIVTTIWAYHNLSGTELPCLLTMTLILQTNARTEL